MGSDVKIHAACERDLDSVVGLLFQQLDQHSVQPPANRLRDAVGAVLRNKGLGFILTARTESEVIGFVYVSFVWSMEHAGQAGWLEEIHVTPEHRSAGVGEALLKEALRQATSEHCGAVDLEVDASHARASALYDRQGFIRLDRTRWVKKLFIPSDQH